MYDEFYRVYSGLMAAVTPILGPKPTLLPEDFWVFFVPPGDGGVSLGQIAVAAARSQTCV